MKTNTVVPFRRPPAPEPELELHFDPAGLDSMIDMLARKVVDTIRAREAARQRTSAQPD